jgi:hypothetical protein
MNDLYKTWQADSFLLFCSFNLWNNYTNSFLFQSETVLSEFQ